MKKNKKIIIISLISVISLVALIILTMPKNVNLKQVNLSTEIKQETKNDDNEDKRNKSIKDTADKLEKNHQGRKTNIDVYLTFDDGPDGTAEKEADILKENNINGTFFLIGNKFDGNERIINKLIKQGNAIGAHSMTHDPKILYDKKNPQIFNEQNKVLELLEKRFNYKTNLMRFPYGTWHNLKSSIELRRVAEKSHKIILDWNIDSHDYDNPGNMLAPYHHVIIDYNREIAYKNKPHVVLLHQLKNSLYSLQKIIDFYRDKGATFKIFDMNNPIHLNFENDKYY